MMNNLPPLPDRRLFTIFTVVALIGFCLIISSFIGAGDSGLFCTESISDEFYSTTTTPLQLDAILHYATALVVPQQSLAEITISFDVLLSISPCNFLVFGLGHDSLMWASFNPHGKTLFLEEDAKWVLSVLKTAPDLNVFTVDYQTKLSDADDLLNSYHSEPECSPSRAFIQGNTRCKLAITGLPDEVYDTEWDIIMIDAPRGYYNEAPGRMGAIYFAAVMARNRKKPGITHVFLHDVDRKVEKEYAEEFLCRKNLKKGVGRLWHFEIPPAENVTGGGARFC
ncbi:probable methyltransferase At1g27930 [Cynara cardunculus var. scolymus]|uniref:Putative polysaccharide biosynthesis protein n=1 Tax=Cynara cardunculus var. scolymus TaxID=59895 RepID=A0A118JYI5_CYNCS|nr:probable methyltransferase At1g27930 [Cynara cardunculus var. scolymus]KVH97827.1 putative polysaccharide biosynthesis protein [Cynara cardunculus var. scolymus]